MWGMANAPVQPPERSVLEHSQKFIQNARELHDYCIDNELASYVLEMDIEDDLVDVDVDDDIVALMEAIFTDGYPPDRHRSVKEGFEERWEDINISLRQRTKRLRTGSLSRQEAQVLILTTIPIWPRGWPGDAFNPDVALIIMSRLSDGADLVTREEFESLKDDMEQKLMAAKRTVQRAQFLGNVPETYPSLLTTDLQNQSLAPLQGQTWEELRNRQRRRGKGATVNDVIQDALDDSRTVRPLQDFLAEYMQTRSSADGVALVHYPSTSRTPPSFELRGIVPDGEDLNTKQAPQPRLEGIKPRLSPLRTPRPDMVQTTDRLSVDGTKCRYTWAELEQFNEDRLAWLCTTTDPEQDPPDGNRPSLTPAEGRDRVKSILGPVTPPSVAASDWSPEDVSWTDSEEEP